MSSDDSWLWPVLSLKAAGISLIDCDHRTPPARDSGYPYIAIPQLKDGHISLEGVRRISESDFTEWTKKLAPQADDVVVVRRCNSGQSAYIPPDLKCAIGQNLVVLRSDGSKVSQKYLRWLVRGTEWWSEVEKYINVGAVFDSLRCRDIPNFELPIPSLDEQNNIVEILTALDDRITLLRETNKTLESIAQALFKSWFVDFDPVRAKMEGRQPEGMDEATAALFPSSFEDSQLGKVPMGWKKSSIYETCHVIYGAPFSSKLFNDHNRGSALIRIRDLKSENPNIFTEEVHPKGYMTQPGDIVVGMDGEFRAYIWGGIPAWLNQRVCVFQPKPTFSHPFVLFSIRPLLAAVEASETATTVIHLGKNDIDRFNVLIPPDPILKIFGIITIPIYERIVAAKKMATSLASLRDTLLPRLISGRLRLPEIAHLVGETAA